jgi:HK97 gp10 family phage protein
MNTTVQLTGFKELEAELAKLSKAAGKGALRRAGIKAMVPMAKIASQRAPVDEGNLQASIMVSARAKGAGADIGKAEFGAVLRGGGSRAQATAALRDARRAANEGQGEPSIELFMGPAIPATDKRRAAIKAIVQEFGSMKQAPQPYMRPAWDQDHRAMLDRLKVELWAEVSKAVKRAEIRAAKLAASRG